MRIHHFRFLTPDLARILEVANQFFLLGIHADAGLAAGLMRRSLSLDVLKLLVTLGMLLACRLLTVGAQTIALLSEQATNDRFADAMTARL